jgi:hypothetical protein
LIDVAQRDSPMRRDLRVDAPKEFIVHARCWRLGNLREKTLIRDGAFYINDNN